MTTYTVEAIHEVFDVGTNELISIETTTVEIVQEEGDSLVTYSIINVPAVGLPVVNLEAGGTYELRHSSEIFEGTDDYLGRVVSGGVTRDILILESDLGFDTVETLLIVLSGPPLPSTISGFESFIAGITSTGVVPNGDPFSVTVPFEFTEIPGVTAGEDDVFTVNADLNSDTNIVFSGAGDDTILLTGRAEFIDAGDDFDRIVLNGFSGNYTISVVSESQGIYNISNGFDIFVDVTGVEELVFDDGTFDISAFENTAPILSVGDLVLAPSEWANIGQDVTYFDQEGDAAETYTVMDDTGSNSFWLSGVGIIDATGGYTLSADDLDGLWVRGESSPGVQTLSISANDGQTESDVFLFNLTTEAANVAPVVSVSDVTVAPSEWTQIGLEVAFFDADGDAAVSYEIWDSEGGDNFWVQFEGTVDASSGYQIEADQLDGLWARGDASGGSQTLWIRAYDGEEWSAWDSFEFTTQGSNTAPTVTVDTISGDTSSWVEFDPAVTYMDAENDDAVQYELWDSQGGNSFWVQFEGTVDASSGYIIDAEQLEETWLRTDDTPGEQTLWLRAYDGTDWGEWDSFTFETLA